MEDFKRPYHWDAHFLRLVTQEGSFHKFALQFRAFGDLLTQSDTHGLDKERIVATVTSIRQLAGFFLQWELASQQIKQKLATETASILEERLDEDRSGSHVCGKEDDTSALRRFFLDHLEDPFPNQQEKDVLVAETNRNLAKPSYTDRKVTTWFINTRRRCGWSVFRKVFAKRGGAEAPQVRVNLKRLYAAVQAQPEVPPPGVQDCVAALMIELNVPLDADSALAKFREQDEEEKAKSKRSIKTKAKPSQKGARSVQADPTGAARARVCRELYAHMVDTVSCSVRDRVSPWFDDVLKTIKKSKPQKTGAVASSSSSASHPSSSSSSRAVAPLPKRSSRRLVHHIPAKGHVPSSSGRPSAQNLTGPGSAELPSVLRKPLTSRKTAFLPGSESGPRLPSVLQTPHMPTASAEFWQQSSGTHTNPIPAGLDFNSVLPLSIANASSLVSSSHPHGLNIGFPATLRNVSSQSVLSSSSVTGSAYTGYGSSFGSSMHDSMCSSQTSMASLMGSVGMSEPDMVCSSASEAGGSLDGWQSTPSDLEPSFASFPGSSMSSSPLLSSPPVTYSNTCAPSSSGKRNRICSEGDAEDTQESAKKRNRAGRRPRHTDGGATSSLTQGASTYSNTPATPMVCSSPDFSNLASTSLPMPILGADLNLGLPSLPQYPQQIQAQLQPQTQQQLLPYMPESSFQMAPDAILSAKAMEMAAMAWCYSAMAQNFSAISRQMWNPHQLPMPAPAQGQVPQRFTEFQGPNFSQAPPGL
ncbi:hypothetical protein OC846_000520 [Tilletia horrida]|uniref:Homeobox domain-containing protein n=1 Tax=Tilletia horrida TaxID=155126 RepID=A0AAN6JTS3_9BASI|nr:hypothetical protein OC846_000520 [Tilletia horrida]